MTLVLKKEVDKYRRMVLGILLIAGIIIIYLSNENAMTNNELNKLKVQKQCNDFLMTCEGLCVSQRNQGLFGQNDLENCFAYCLRTRAQCENQITVT